ncbi:dipeptidase [Salsuginibacillus halophilus]|uniref:Dipeptidase n=1 Tax=Salsuginibacillus halophilus TaxID=517424 RepID=A0A2P8HQX9_9BACI|nr:S-layer homology domain-containing protein [Salsuginibacillus halophilus]PSL48582.1 dipeptidase [Salsuginibacillus halophilus]
MKYKRSVTSLALAAGLGGLYASGAMADDDAATQGDAPGGVPETDSKSIGFYVGSDLTADGNTILGGFGHEPSSHWIDIVPRQTHAEGSMTTVGATEEARLTGELIEIPQVEETNKYISSSYSEFAGFPQPLTNGGLNDKGLAARDIWSPSRDELVEMTPDPQQGPQYSDLARFAMERAGSAEEAVDVIGGLIDEHGFTTYGGNSHLFADEDEGWVFINYAGGEGLWAAERLGSDDIRVSYPGYINDFPVDFEDNDDFKASENLVSFAEEQGWYDPEEDDPDYMDLQKVYGEPFPAEGVEEDDDHYIAQRDPHEREEELADMGEITLEDMLAHVRDPRWSNDYAGYGQTVELRSDVPDELQTLWLATTGSVTTPYVPIPIATEEVPPEFLQHRYMTKDSDSDFLDPDYAHQEATRSAVREFKRLMYFTCESPEDFLKHVTGEIEGFEMDLLAERSELEAEAEALLNEGDVDAAAALITENVNENLMDSLALGMDLTDQVEAETRENSGIRLPEGEVEEGETTPATSQPMTGGMVTCYDPELEYPREFGEFTDAADVPEEDEDAEAPAFGDVPADHYAASAIARMTNAGVITGYDEDTFAPDNDITRSEIATMIVRAFDLDTSDRPALPEEAGVDTAHDMYEAIAAVYNEGWMTGDNEGFRPDDSLNRDEMATVLTRVFELDSGSAAYDDVEADYWANDAIGAVTEAGLASGISESEFGPRQATTRAQLALFLDRGLN